MLERLPLVTELRMKVADFLRAAFFVRLGQYLPYLRSMNDVSLLFQTQSFPTGCVVPLCVRYLQKLMEPSSDEVVPKFLADFKSSFSNAVETAMAGPLFEKSNCFLKASLFHPGIAPFLPCFVPEHVLEECWEAIACDMEAISTKNLDYSSLSLSKYRKWIKSLCVLPMPDVVLALLKDGGFYAGYRPLEFWQAIANNREMIANEFGGSFLLPVVSMVLALPAGESVDEFTFSSSQRTVTKDRNRLSPTHIEQITVIRMFIRNFGWSPTQLGVWLEEAHQEQERRMAERSAVSQ